MGQTDFKRKLQEVINVSGVPAVSVVSELIVEGALGAFIPGATAVIFNYKQQRMEKNILILLTELNNRIKVIEDGYNSMNEINKKVFKEYLSGVILDYVIDEQQEEKVAFIASGFTNLIRDHIVDEEKTLLYFDVLKELRIIDIKILSHHDYGRNGFVLTDQNSERYLKSLNIDYDTYTHIKEKLMRLKLLQSSYDREYRTVIEKLNNVIKHLDSMQKGKNKELTPFTTSFLPKTYENISLSTFGKSFLEFFIEQNGNK